MNKAKDYTFTLLAKQPLYSLRSQWDKTKDFELFFEMVKCRYFMLIVLFAVAYENHLGCSGIKCWFILRNNVQIETLKRMEDLNMV